MWNWWVNTYTFPYGSKYLPRTYLGHDRGLSTLAGRVWIHRHYFWWHQAPLLAKPRPPQQPVQRRNVHKDLCSDPDVIVKEGFCPLTPEAIIEAGTKRGDQWCFTGGRSWLFVGRWAKLSKWHVLIWFGKMLGLLIGWYDGFVLANNSWLRT